MSDETRLHVELPERTRKMPPNTGKISRKGDEARQRATDDYEKSKVVVLGLIRQGLSPADAMKQVGRSGATFYTWTRKSSKFRAQAAEAREAFERQQAQSRVPWREQQDQFEPIVRDNYETWTEYVVDFRQQYLGFDTFDHQWKILEAIENAPGGGITMILVPPEAGKSTLLCDAIVADLCSSPNMRISLISEGQDLARKMMARVQRRLIWEGGAVPPLIEHFGPFQPLATSNKKWNADEFTVLASSHDEADPSVISVGIKGNIRGTRWDKVYLDDVQSVRNESQTPQLMRIFREDVTSRPNMQSGKIIITGSRVGRNDFYGEIERLDLADEIVCISALDLTKPIGSQSYFPRQFRTITSELGETVEVPIVDDKGDQLGFSDDDFAQRRKKVGEDAWQRVYMQKPQTESSAMVTDEDILAATDGGQNGTKVRRVASPAEGSVGVIAGLDPSLSNHAAFTYCGYDAEHLYVLALTDLFRPTVNRKIYEEIERGTRRFRPDWWVIENNTLQSGYLTDDAFIDLKNQWGFNAVGHHTGDNKTNRDLGVPAMMGAIQRGEIRFPVLDESNTEFVTLYEQLKSWRPDIPTKRLVQDQVMSLWFCYLRWRQLRELVGQTMESWRRPGLDSVTLYPHARSNLSLPPEATLKKTPMTYEQVWDSMKDSA